MTRNLKGLEMHLTARGFNVTFETFNSVYITELLTVKDMTIGSSVRLGISISEFFISSDADPNLKINFTNRGELSNYRCDVSLFYNAH